tara:strand:+ start:272 stop:457 length:186 start_codon:yes stop_codon:yes gene_type:complete
MEKPEIVEDKHLKFLDNLRDSGDVNMFGASEYVQEAFDISNRNARDILVYWMETYGERQQK